MKIYSIIILLLISTTVFSIQTSLTNQTTTQIYNGKCTLTTNQMPSIYCTNHYESGYLLQGIFRNIITINAYQCDIYIGRYATTPSNQNILPPYPRTLITTCHVTGPICPKYIIRCTYTSSQ